MNSIFNAIVKFFEHDEWNFLQIENATVLQMGYSGANGEWMCFAQALDDEGIFLFYSICPVKVPSDKKLAVAEFLTRTNKDLLIGNFEMDFADGSIQYKTSIGVKNENLTFGLIEPLVYVNVLMMDKYLPGIMSVIYGGVSPEWAVIQVENSLDEDDEDDDDDDLDDLDDDDLDDLDDDDLDDDDLDDDDDFLDDDDDDDDNDNNNYKDKNWYNNR